MKMNELINFNVYENFPSEGVRFIDFTPSYYDIKSRNFITNNIGDIIDSLDIDFNNTIIVAPEARGFILGSMIAYNYDLPLIIVRKESKFPSESIAISGKYETEYSSDCLAIQKYDLTGKTCIFIDDVFATGGTYQIVKDLCSFQGAKEVIPIVIYDVGISNCKELKYLFNQDNL